MIHFEGDRTFAHPADFVFARLGDASFLVSCLKDVEEITEKSADRAVWKLTPGFSFVRTKLDIAMDIVERIPSNSINIKMVSRGIGAASTVMAVLTFKALDLGTAVHWSADITELTGLMKLVPKGLISSAAGKVIEETWTEIEKKLQ